MTDMAAKTKQQRIYRTHKSRIFEMVFSKKEELLKLYNAVNKSNYDDPELLEINTLENAVYMSMHNDISFIIDFRLCLYEHQSTFSPNLPLRYLMYVSDLYSKITKDGNLYGSKPVELPTPRFVIFYNGEDEMPDVRKLRLSDAYAVKEEAYSLELLATMLNINPGHNEELLAACKPLGDYARYTDRVRTYAKELPLGEAVERAVEECIRDDVLAEFLRTNRAEAVSVSIYEYDEEKTMRQLKEEYLEEGRESGIYAFIEGFAEEGFSRERIIEKLISKFSLTHGQAEEYYRSYTTK